MRVGVDWRELQGAVRRFDLVRRHVATTARVVVADGKCRIDIYEDGRHVSTVVRGQPDEDGIAVVRAAEFHDFVLASDADIGSLTYDGERLTLVANGRISLRAASDDTAWPRWEVLDSASVSWSPEALTVLGRIVHAAGTDDARPVLTGVHICDGWATAMDTRRLAAAQIPVPDGTDLIVPGDVIKAVVRGAGSSGLEVRASERQATFALGATEVTTSLVVGDLPDWRSVIPANPPHHLVFDRVVLLDALRRLSVLADRDDFGTIRVQPGEPDGTVALRAVAADLGDQDDSVPGSTSLAGTAFAFKPLKDLAEACCAAEIRLRSNGPLDWFVVEEDGFVGMICPIRVR